MYHVVFRGINRHNIFEEDEDFIKFKDIVKDLKQEMQFKIYAFCLMSNHVHILLNEYNTGDISAIMKKLLFRYAGWFNRKYSRSGALIGNRFKSKLVEKDEYLLSLVRYIHQNPIRAKTVRDLDEYKWSGHSEYIHESTLTDTEFILSMTDKNSFEIYHQQEEKGFYKVSDRIGKSEGFSIRQIERATGVSKGIIARC